MAGSTVHRTDLVELHRWSRPVEYGASAEDQVLVAAELGELADEWMRGVGVVVPKSVRNAKDPHRGKRDGYEPLLVEVYIQVPLGMTAGDDPVAWTPRGSSWFERHTDETIAQAQRALGIETVEDETARPEDRPE